MTQSYTRARLRTPLPMEEGEDDASEDSSGVVVELSVPIDEFVLTETLQAVPEAELQFGEVVANGEGSVTPLLEARADDYEALEEALDADDSVASVSTLATFDTKRLYRVRWSDHARLAVDILTTAEATVLDLVGTGSGWTVQLLYPSREHFASAYEVCEAHNFTPDLRVVRAFDDQDWKGFELTSKQFESLRLAHEGGYYEVPRETNLKEMADELDVSHQALSERLRRAQGALVRDALDFEAADGE